MDCMPDSLRSKMVILNLKDLNLIIFLIPKIIGDFVIRMGCGLLFGSQQLFNT